MSDARKVVCLWLCFHATIGFLHCCLQERIFYVVLQEVTTSNIIFLSNWSQATNLHNMQRLLLGFDIICPNATFKHFSLLMARSNGNNGHIFYVVL
jgi:hypothetical protein